MSGIIFMYIYDILATQVKCNISSMKENSGVFNFAKKEVNIISRVQSFASNLRIFISAKFNTLKVLKLFKDFSENK